MLNHNIFTYLSKNFMHKKKYYLLLFFIIVIAIFPRAAQIFSSNNYYFGSEQAVEYLITKDIVVDHKVVLVALQGGFGDILKPAGFNYLLAVPFILADGNPFGGRIFMFLISILTIITAFVFFNRMFGLKISFLVSFLLAISPNLKDYVGSVSTPSLIPFLTILLLYCIFKAFNGKKEYIPIILFTVGLMAHFEMAVSGILSAFFILTAIFCVIKKVNIKPRYYFFSIIMYVIPFIPILLFDTYNNFHNIKGVIKLISAGGETSAKHSFSSILIILQNRIEIFGWDYVSSFSSNPLLWIPILFVIVYGMYLLIKNKKNKFTHKSYLLYIATIPLFTFIFTLFYPSQSIHQWWLGNLNIIYYLLLGLSLNYLWKNNYLKLFIILMFFLLSLAFINRTYFIYKTQFAFPPNTYIKEEGVIDYIFKDARNKPFGISVFTTGSKKTYEYLIWWKRNKIYHYQPYSQKKELYYNLYDPSYVNIYTKNKQKSFVNDKNIKIIKLPYGYIIEKISN